MVSDMTGDGRPDIIVVQPKDSTVTLFMSDDGYHTN